MTPEELARVPDGGAIYSGSAEFGYWIRIGRVDLGVTRVDESIARQIVGSVNAAIIRNTKCTRDGFFSSNEAMADFNFWLNYAKGNA